MSGLGLGLSVKSIMKGIVQVATQVPLHGKIDISVLNEERKQVFVGPG